jgi:hypothetical protein
VGWREIVTQVHRMGFLTLDGRCAGVFPILAVARHAETKQPVNGGGEDVTLGGKAQPRRVGGGVVDDVHQIEQADDQHQRGILEQRR